MVKNFIKYTEPTVTQRSFMQENYRAIRQDINLENTDFFTLTSLYALIEYTKVKATLSIC